MMTQLAHGDSVRRNLLIVSIVPMLTTAYRYHISLKSCHKIVGICAIALVTSIILTSISSDQRQLGVSNRCFNLSLFFVTRVVDRQTCKTVLDLLLKCLLMGCLPKFIFEAAISSIFKIQTTSNFLDKSRKLEVFLWQSFYRHLLTGCDVVITSLILLLIDPYHAHSKKECNR